MGNPDCFAIIRTARFDERDRDGWIGRELVGEGAPCRPGADDDEIVAPAGHGFSSSPLGAKCQISRSSRESTTPSSR